MWGFKGSVYFGERVGSTTDGIVGNPHPLTTIKGKSKALLV